MAAYADALERCSTEAAPWHIIPADRKWYRNWAITQLLCEELEELGLEWPAAGLRRQGRAAAGPLGSLESAPMDLDAVEVRVLGCLVEKQRTTPDVYPLSLNALRAACNQSTNRDPSSSTTRRRSATRCTGSRGGAGRASPAARGPRSTATCSTRTRAGASPEQALLAVLMLRGPQTPGELRRASTGSTRSPTASSSGRSTG